MTTGTTTTAVLTDTAIARIEKDAIATSSPVLAKAQAVQITTPDTYHSADLLLVQIKTAIKTIDQQIEDDLNTPIIKPAYEALEGMYALRRKILAKCGYADLTAAEKQVKGKMAAWQAEQNRIREEAERVRRRAEAEAQREAQRRLDEEVRLRREAEEAQRRAERAAQTDRENAARQVALAEEAKLRAEAAERQAREAEAKVEAIQEAPIVRKTVAAGSNVKKTRRWRLKNDGEGMSDLIKAVAAGEVPETVLQVNEEVMDSYYQRDRGLVENWPGVEGFDDFTIAGRGSR